MLLNGRICALRAVVLLCITDGKIHGSIYSHLIVPLKWLDHIKTLVLYMNVGAVLHLEEN